MIRPQHTSRRWHNSGKFKFCPCDITNAIPERTDGKDAWTFCHACLSLTIWTDQKNPKTYHFQDSL